MKILLCASLLLSSLSTAAQAQDIKTLFDRRSEIVQPTPPIINPYNYTLDVMFAGKKGKDIVPPFTAKLLINPAAEGEARARILSTSSDDYNDEFKEMLAEIQEQTIEEFTDEFWCDVQTDASLDGGAFTSADFTVLRETETEAVVRPNPQRLQEIFMAQENVSDMSKGELKLMRKMIKRLDGEMTFSKPDLLPVHLKMWMTEPMTVKVIAKIKNMEMEQSCAYAPNGFPYVERLSMDMQIKALGIKFEQMMGVRVSELTLRNK